jgi:parallel beta-helix repeat protein
VEQSDTANCRRPALDKWRRAGPGATITVLPGTYAERLTISKRVKLYGERAILDGLAGGLDGRHVGIEVKSDDSDGIILFTVQNSEIVNNFIHDNGSIGLWLGLGSSGNTVRSNRVSNNGTQQGLPGSGRYGVGIFTSGMNNTRNEIFDNDVSGSYWGILIGGSPDSANIVQTNRVYEHQRAGIAVYGQHNIIEGNMVRDSGSANMPPSCRLDLMDLRDLDNTWRNNTGTFGSAGPDPFRNDACSKNSSASISAPAGDRGGAW